MAAVATGLSVQPASAIIVRDDVGLANSVDANNQYPAVVQLFDWDVGGVYGGGAGSIYYNCTGTLINPRTILTATHCVSNEGATGSEDWGAPGQAPLTKIVSFGVDSSDRLFNFLNSPTLLGYNEGGVAFSTDVIEHPSSELSHGNQAFPWTDTTLIALNEPVSDVNPMGMLLSPVTSLTHVVQIGYGTVGTGDTGQQGIGTVRIMGENMLGLLGSDSDFIDGVFPAVAPSALTLGFETQVEYYTDFDNPNRPAANAGCTFTGSDINCATDADIKNIDYFGDNALPHESSTAPGDSGGPLIADQIYSKPLVIGDLSGGWTFFGTDANPYDPVYGGNGTSFYQPLFSVWQFIVENNPYKYVGAKAGDGAWEDPNHWVQLQDPNIYIIDANGNVVVGTPTGTECGVYQTTPKIGSVEGVSIADNSSASSPYYFPPGSGTCGVSSGGQGMSQQAAAVLAGSAVSATATSIQATADTAGLQNDVSHTQLTGKDGKPVSSQAWKQIEKDSNPLFAALVSKAQSQAAPTYDPNATDPQDYGGNLPRSSVLLGPGSTGFVPNNTDGQVGVAYANPAQYFDVRLTQDGTTSLSTPVEVDRLTLAGNAGLNVTSDGLLLSNIDVEVYDNANLNVDGILGTSDIVADGGLVSGNGIYVLGASVVQTDLSAILIGNGAITAGGAGTVGAMTVLGNVGISSGGLWLVDSAGSVNGQPLIDFLDVYGVLAVNGTIEFHSTVTPYWHQGGIFAEADKIVTDGMSVPDTVTGVLYPVVALTHGASYDSLSVELEAAPFSSVFTPRNGNEANLATLLTNERGSSYNALAPIYHSVDVLEGSDLADAFDQLLPNQQAGIMSSGEAGLNVVSNTIAQRLNELRFAHRSSGSSSTGFANRAADQLTLAMNQTVSPDSPFVQSSFAQAFADKPNTLTAAASGNVTAGTAVTPAQAGGPGQWGGFLTASAINGSSQYGTRDRDITGYMVSAGLDTMVDDTAVLGAAFSVGEADSDLPYVAGKSEVQSYQGTVYGTWSDDGGDFYVNGFAGYGGADIKTRRVVTLGGTSYGATASPNGDQAIVNLSMGTQIPTSWNVTFYPTGGLEYDYFHTDAYTETGGPVAMHVDDDSSSMLLVRVGAEAVGDFTFDDGGVIHPHARAAWVGALSRDDGTYNAAFAAAPGGMVQLVNAHDSNWLEFGAGLDATVGDGVSLGISYDATVGRREASYGAVTGRLRVVF